MIHKIRVALSRMGFRPGEYSGNYESLKKLYRSPDPWRLQSAKEIRRFEMTRDVIERLVPSCNTLLEIGSGEGLQTEYFARAGHRVTGIELSADAIGRARRRVPHAEFHEARAEDVVAIVGDRRFDIATACEILYYSPDAGQILRDLRDLAPRILVTNHSKQAFRLAALLEGPGWRRLANIRAGKTVWRCDLWECSSIQEEGPGRA